MSVNSDGPGLNEANHEDEESGVRFFSGDEPAANARVPKRVRRLKPNELVSHGDFVGDGREGLALWVGPSGFRADSFVKPIYRQNESRTAGGSKKPK
jgi:hypothetical protein